MIFGPVLMHISNDDSLACASSLYSRSLRDREVRVCRNHTAPRDTVCPRAAMAALIRDSCSAFKFQFIPPALS